MSWETLMFSIIIILFTLLFFDVVKPFSYFKEGFMTGAGDNPFLFTYFPRRGDISFAMDDSAYYQDNRHVMGYADVQGLGVNHDFCRMIVPKNKDAKQMFFACALAGTENMNSVSFRTQTVKDGFLTSRDDYMRDADDDGKSDYCAIVRVEGGRFEPRCYRALTTTFDTRSYSDKEPPKDIADVLYFYEGIMFWFRFIDDLKDYAENLTVSISGKLEIDEFDVKLMPSQFMNSEKKDTTDLKDRIEITEGVKFNGTNQFIRLSDSPTVMTFGTKISLPLMKAISFWVKFDEFTNNAHIIDFGNGAGMDNVFIGIVGRGDPSLSDGATLRRSPCDKYDDVIPKAPSGAQKVTVMTPQELMLSTTKVNTSANIFDKGIKDTDLESIRAFKNDNSEKGDAHTKYATLIYEVWNGKLRKEHINVLKAFKLKKWTYCCITSASTDAIRPTVQIWIDGDLVAEKQDSHLPQTNTDHNYIGKNNWMADSSQYENKPELFKGNLFDLRGYMQPMTRKKIEKTIEWGKQRLGLKK